MRGKWYLRRIHLLYPYPSASFYVCYFHYFMNNIHNDFLIYNESEMYEIYIMK